MSSAIKNLYKLGNSFSIMFVKCHRIKQTECANIFTNIMDLMDILMDDGFHMRVLQDLLVDIHWLGCIGKNLKKVLVHKLLSVNLE
jgi:hypothetical protein